jgi:hypothetical protein
MDNHPGDKFPRQGGQFRRGIIARRQRAIWHLLPAGFSALCNLQVEVRLLHRLSRNPLKGL